MCLNIFAKNYTICERRSKILEEEVINEESAVNKEALVLFRWILRQFEPILVIFGGVFGPAVKEMCDFANFISFSQVVHIGDVVLELINFWGNGVDLDDIVVDLIEAPARKNEQVSFLRIFALNSIHNLVSGIVNRKLLKLLGKATTVKYSILNNPTYILIFIVDPNLRSIIRRKAKVKIPEGNIGRMIVVVLADNSPRSMARGDENAVEETDLLLEGEVDVAFVVEGLVGGVEGVLVGEVAGHEGQADAKGDGDGVVAVLEGVGHLAQDEVLFVFEAGPVEHLVVGRFDGKISG